MFKPTSLFITLTFFFSTLLMLSHVSPGLAQQTQTNLKEIIHNGALLVDVRTPEEFAEGHVKGSVNIPVDDIQANLKRFQTKAPIVVFCRSGNRSARAKSILEQNGINKVYNGGTWQQVDQLLKAKK